MDGHPPLYIYCIRLPFPIRALHEMASLSLAYNNCQADLYIPADNSRYQHTQMQYKDILFLGYTFRSRHTGLLTKTLQYKQEFATSIPPAVPTRMLITEVVCTYTLPPAFLYGLPCAWPRSSIYAYIYCIYVSEHIPHTFPFITALTS